MANSNTDSGAGPEQSSPGARRPGAGLTGPPQRAGGGSPQRGAGNPPPQSRWRWVVYLVFLLALLGINWWLADNALSPNKPANVSYSFFYQQVQAGNVADINWTGNSINGTLHNAAQYPPGSTNKTVKDFATERPLQADDNLTTLMLSKNVTIDTHPPPTTPFWQEFLLGFGPTLLLIALIFLGMRAMSRGAGGIGGIGRSKAKLYSPDVGPRTTFQDVAGIDEVADEVKEIVDFLRHPERYQRLGAMVPKGVLLAGPPGTGKTLLARAVAGEANVPFFSVSASEFVEMIVGVGASRVRDLFRQAKAVAPAIIFIDELDAIGGARGGPQGLGGNDEREQTLNQILTEMDGFTGSERVVVVAATNRVDVLDPALLRPGRFDRRVVVSPPDQTGRRQILAVHTRGVPLAPDIDLDAIAAATPGMVGADLRNLVNESALLAARRGHERVQRADVTDALEKIVLGTARKIMMSAEEKERTAYHESGHALLGMLTPGADPVRKISIIPRGQSLGVTFQAPATDRYGYSGAYLRGRIVGALGGRAAEDLVYGEVTTGAESDLEQVASIARQMVGRWGMSDAIGPVTVLPPAGQASPLLSDGSGPSQSTRELVDKEVRRIVDECYAQAVATLQQHRSQLDRLARRLLERETLDEADAYAAAGIQHPRHAPAPVAAQTAVQTAVQTAARASGRRP
jgi:cell division protease FtsH